MLRPIAARRTDPVVVTLAPKPAGGHRRMATLSRRDGERWDEIASRIADTVRRRTGPEVVSPVAGSAAPLGPALARARSAATELVARSPLVLRTDVADFYGSVMPRAVLDALRRAGCHGDAAEAVGMLEGWESGGCPGLPIGPRGSAIVAEAVLAEVDRALRPLRFLRWVDDYLVAAASEQEIAEALERLDAALERVGLRRSVPKTAVTPATGFRWLGTSLVAASA